jgi:D-3-phosphoglycerate dehydrogenase
MKKIVIAGKAHPVLHETFLKNGFESIYAPSISRDELLELLPGLSGLVLATRIGADKEMIEKGSSLEWIARLGSGMDHIDTSFAASKNIRCISSPEGNCRAVAEHALGMLLSMMNNICRASRQIGGGQWLRDENRGVELSGKTIGIIGYGHTGSAFAGLLSSFGVEILAYDKYKFGFGDSKVREASLEQIGRYADVISFHVPLTDETAGMAGASFFDSLLRNPWIINTSRGGVVNEDALLQALDKGKVRGACLDVLENEDLSSLTAVQRSRLERLSGHPAVMLTPHIAGYTDESFYKVSFFILQKLGLAV